MPAHERDACPSGHASDESDYCSVCGAAIVAVAAARLRRRGRRPASIARTPPVDRRAPCAASPARPDARFCEVCRYDFVVAPAARLRVAAVAGSCGPCADARPPAGGSWCSPSIRRSTPSPIRPRLRPAEPERVFPVEQAEMLVGRRDDRQNIRPAVPLHDPGASRRHAKFLLGADGTVSLHDLGSTNGTKLNGEDVVSGLDRDR